MTPATFMDPAPASAPVETAPKRYAFSIEEYLQLFEKGILSPDLRTELINGEVLQMTPPGPEHILLTIRLRDFFLRRVPKPYCILTETPIQFGKDLLHPGVAIVQGRRREITALCPISDSATACCRCASKQDHAVPAADSRSADRAGNVRTSYDIPKPSSDHFGLGSVQS